MSIKNAHSLPKRYFGMHFCPGTAEYREAGKDPYRIFLNEATIKKMDPSFECRPVYVQHVDEVNVSKLQEEADGYVVKSFYNEADGKHWAEFIVVSDKGHDAISRGWRLSNAYTPKEYGAAGVWNGQDYSKEVLKADYDHLAIVPNPRYDESVIYTPEGFKTYNENKRIELRKIANSKDKPKGETKMGIFAFSKKEKVENSADLEAMVVTLPNSKKDMSLVEAIKIADMVTNMNGYANGDHMVKCGEEEMSVNDLVDKHMKMVNKMKKNDEKAKEMKANVDLDGGEKEAEKQKAKSDKTENGDVEMDGDEVEDSKKNKKKNATDEDETHFMSLKNARDLMINQAPIVDLDKAARGKSRYGSGK